MDNRLNFEDLLLIAEATLGVPADELERTVCIYRAESSLAAPFARICGTDLYADPVEQAAVCALRLIRSRPFLAGNRAVGYECMREMLARSGYRWTPSMEEAKEIDGTLALVEAGETGEAGFIGWVRERTTA